jgi:hypothetical protein
VSILIAAGLNVSPIPGELDSFNFVPRICMPTLMINGRNDFLRPLDPSQRKCSTGWTGISDRSSRADNHGVLRRGGINP